MKAVLCKAYGPPESLVVEDVVSPEPGPGEVVVSVKAASVNFPDVLIIQNKYQFKPQLPFSPGSEVAGVVKTIGDGVTTVKPGDRVMAFTTYGAFAEEVKTEATRLLPLPPAMDFTHAAAFGLSGISEALYEQDMRVLLCPTMHEHDREVSLLDRLMRGTTDGAILMLPQESRDELRALQSSGFPFVVVDPRDPLSDDLPCVTAAHTAGATHATEHLLTLGHRRIGVITGEPEWAATVERMAGYHSALGAAGVLRDPELEVHGNWQIASGYDGARRLLDLDDP